MTKIKIKVSEQFKPLYTANAEEVDLMIAIGGRGGMKTYEVSKFCAFDATIRKRRVAVLRDEKETINETILNEIFLRYDTANKYGHFDGLYDKQANGIKDKQTEEMLVFTKGFRASSLQKQANLKGISDVDTAVIEEAEDIRDPKKFNTFVDSVRTKERLIIIMLNTPDIQHWLVKRYFTLVPVTLLDVSELKHIQEKDLDGYWKLKPKELKGFKCIQTSFRDNSYLPQTIIDSYNAYGDPDAPSYDLHYYLTAICGFASSGRKGQVLRGVKPISLIDYMKIGVREVFGQDFGTSAAAGLVGVKIDGNNCYARQLNYVGLDTKSLMKLYCKLQIDNEEDIIIADSADPISIGKIRRGFESDELSEEERLQYPKIVDGFNIYGAVKGPGSIEAGIGLLNSMNLHAVTESEDLWNEIYNYIYAQNKSGEYTNIPEDSFNHLIDPWRYVAQSRGRFF